MSYKLYENTCNALMFAVIVFVWIVTGCLSGLMIYGTLKVVGVL